MKAINSKKTFCPDLWDGVTIIKTGDVYSCCLTKPQKLGNIYKSHLKDIINNRIIKSYRVKSLKGNLECYEKCNFVRKNIINVKIPDNIEINYRDLKRLHISFSEKCNIQCIMCHHPINHKRYKITIDHSILIKNIDISPFENILIQGGEPLCIDNCLYYLDYLATMGKKYLLLTNGTLIDKEMARRLAKEAKGVVISINAATKKTHETINKGSKFEEVLKGINYIREFREKMGTNVLIFGRMTLTIENLKEIPLFIKKYENLGFDLINFGYNRKTVPNFLGSNPEFKNSLRTIITKQLNQSNLNNIDLQRIYQLKLVGKNLNYQK
ncbi:MAG: radical SAM protein [Candidatus Lokiarchaeota archaeon]|nr:radical SAM protein [Candidatus Lokiarchaeota archaeon]